MKELFRGYYRPEAKELEALWKNAVFIFDTNVLLNLYRYQSKTKDQLLKVMTTLSERIWIPHHVALEFQRNRVATIAEQHKRFSDVKAIVIKTTDDLKKGLEDLQLKKRHSHINPDKLFKEIEQLTSKFSADLDELEKDSIQVTSPDTLREQLDKLFINKIGAAPTDQKELDAIFSDGEKRYKNRIPPGFKDTDKEKECFSYGGLLYENKYSDLVIWKQIIAHAKLNKMKNIIYVTDDNKSDWWYKIDSKGSKTISARPELIDEIQREAFVDIFHMYSMEKFLEYANEQINAKITKDAIEEVREVSTIRNVATHAQHRALVNHRALADIAERSVYLWLRNQYDNVYPQYKGFPDLIAIKNGRKFGFEVKFARDARMILHKLEEVMLRIFRSMREEDFSDISLVVVLPSFEEARATAALVEKRKTILSIPVKVIIGFYDTAGSEHGDGIFTAILET